MENFSELYLRDDVVNALENIGVTQPTVIQMLAIPKIAAGKNVLCASETGINWKGVNIDVLNIIIVLAACMIQEVVDQNPTNYR